jgi:hypothetical protein
MAALPSRPGLPSTPPCPRCGSVDILVESLFGANAVRVPIAWALLALTQGDVELFKVWQRCRSCGQRFLGTYLRDPAA